MSHSILLSLTSHPHIRRHHHHPPPPTPSCGNLHIPHQSQFPLPPLTTNPPPPSGRTQIPRSAAGDISSAEEEEKANGKGKGENKRKLELAMIFGLWYAYNIIFNIYNKKALNVFPYPWLLSCLQLLAGSLWMSVLWSANLQPRPAVSKPFLLALLGPALFHTVGHVSACISFSNAAVSFTHVIKSAEPVFSVAFSAVLGAASYPPPVWLSLLPIVLGCSLAAVTEASFTPAGLWGAVVSNVGFVLRNIYSKKSLNDFRGEVDGLNLYGCITILSLLYLVPVAIFVEGPHWAEGYRRAIEIIYNSGNSRPSILLCLWIGISGVFYHLYNQASYQALDEISPLTFSVGNTMKRVAVIVASLIVFRNQVRPLNALGSAMAIFGTFFYSQATSANKIEREKRS